EMAKAKIILENTSELHSHASFYAPDEFGDVKSAAASGPGRGLLKNALLSTEAEVIKGAVEAGKRIARFRQQKDDEKAVEELDKFGAGIVDVFNHRLSDLFD